MNRNKSTFLQAGISTKLLSLLVVAAFLLSAVPLAVGDDGGSGKEVITQTLSYGEPEYNMKDNGYYSLKIEGADTATAQTGAPLLPRDVVVTELPLGSTDIEVTYTPVEQQNLDFDNDLVMQPSPISAYIDLPGQSRPIITAILKVYDRLLGEKGTDYTDQELPEEIDDSIYNLDGEFGEAFSYDVWVGRNLDNELVTFVVAQISPCVFTSVANNEFVYTTEANLEISYMPPQTQGLFNQEEYELLILAPSGYISDLQPLVAHKEDYGWTTKLVNLEEVYDETYFELPDWMRDDAERVKYFMYKAVREWDVDYVMAVGGWRTVLGLENDKLTFPIRASHNVDGEPGYIAEQYFSCCIGFDPDEGYVFDTWDSNNNDRFAEWDWNGRDTYDPQIDVTFGRLACRSRKEVRTMVEKIINYETTTYDSDWFNTMISVTGDGFQDIGTLGIDWDVTSVQNGDYIMYAQSRTGPSGLYGPIDEVHFTVNHNQESRVTFSELDHTKIKPLDETKTSADYPDVYPAYPVAEITVPSDGDMLGNTNVKYVPSEAYIGERWTSVEYVDNVLAIRGKSYDPVPHDPWDAGSDTDLHVWINNSEGDTVRDYGWRGQSMFYEGEMEAEQAIIFANGGTFGGDVIDDGPFPVDRIWTSNGEFINMNSVLDAFSDGYGLAYVNGHSSCMVYGDHYPGIPGGRDDGQVNGWASINMRFGLERYQAQEGDPLFPLDQLTNGDKLPILLYSGCHSGQFDTSFASLMHDPENVLFGDRYGTWTPEGVAWWITRLPQGGSIATIGNGGLGSGYIGDGILQGLTGWLFPRFFYNYNGQNGPHLDILGDIYRLVLQEYVNGASYDSDVLNDQTYRKHFEQWDLLGDPTLKIGGYPQDTGSLADNNDFVIYDGSSDFEYQIINDQSKGFRALSTNTQVTYNPEQDTSPTELVSSIDGTFLTGYEYTTPSTGEIHPGFAYSKGGVYWTELIWANSIDSGIPSLFTWQTWDDGDNEWVDHYIGSCYAGALFPGVIIMSDPTDPSSWSFYAYWGSGAYADPGRYGCAATAYTDPDSGETTYGAIYTYKGQMGGDGVFGEWIGGDADFYSIASGAQDDFANFHSACDQETNYHYYVFEKTSANEVYIVRGQTKEHMDDISVPGLEPDVAAKDSMVYVVSNNGGLLECRVSDDNGLTYNVNIVGIGENPRIVLNEDGTLSCFYISGNQILKATSDDQGTTWNVEGPLGVTVADIPTPYQVTEQGCVYTPDQQDIYAEIFAPTLAAFISDIEKADGGRASIKANVTNGGTIDIEYLVVRLDVEGDAPLGRYFGGSPLLLKLFQGRVMQGGENNEELPVLRSGETTTIQTSPLFGIGHVKITVSAYTRDGVDLAEKTEDGFLLGGRLFLYYPEE